MKKRIELAVNHSRDERQLYIPPDDNQISRFVLIGSLGNDN
jgi:hypothetical protein